MEAYRVVFDTFLQYAVSKAIAESAQIYCTYCRRYGTVLYLRQGFVRCRVCRRSWRFQRRSDRRTRMMLTLNTAPHLDCPRCQTHWGTARYIGADVWKCFLCHRYWRVNEGQISRVSARYVGRA